MNAVSWQEKYSQLNDELVQAHTVSEPGKLAGLYTRCADAAEQNNDINASCFFLTHALVYSLEAGLAEADLLLERLKSHNRI